MSNTWPRPWRGSRGPIIPRRPTVIIVAAALIVAALITVVAATENYQLSVPAHTAVVLSQPSGHVVITGLSSALRITAASIDISAASLRSPSLTASITSGHLDATFAAAPRRVSLRLTSAQATLHPPAAGPGYQISQQVASGYVHVGVPRVASSPDQVRTRINSGELELLP